MPSFPLSASRLRGRWPIAVLVAGVLLLAGCRGVATKGEAEMRQRLAALHASYRPGAAAAALPALTPASPLEDYLRSAVLRHPQVESAYEEWAATVERITVARSRPDPVLTVGVDLQRGLAESVSDVIMAVMAGVMTELPGPGKLAARAELATGESRVAFARFQQQALAVALAARQQYYELYLIDEQTTIVARNLALVGDIEQALRHRAEAGLAGLQEVLQVESEAERLRAELANLHDKHQAARVAWKSQLGLAAQAPDPPLPAGFSFSAPGAGGDAQLAQVLSGNPRLRVMQAEVGRAVAAVANAYKARVPDFTLGLEAEAPTTPGASNPRDTIWKPRLSVTLPIWRDRIAAEIAEAEAMKLAAEANLSAEQLALTREFALNAFGLREVARNLALLHGELLPRQREIVDLSQRGYQAGTTTFYELIEQQRALLQLELAEAEARVERERLIGELNLALLGHGPLDLEAAAAGEPQS